MQSLFLAHLRHRPAVSPLLSYLSPKLTFVAFAYNSSQHYQKCMGDPIMGAARVAQIGGECDLT